jgi:hypothetical protein
VLNILEYSILCVYGITWISLGWISALCIIFSNAIPLHL